MNQTAEHPEKEPLRRLAPDAFGEEFGTFAFQRENDSTFGVDVLPPMDEQFFELIGELIAD